MKTNNEILNDVYDPVSGSISTIEIEHRHVHKGEAFGYDSELTLVGTVAQHLGLAVGSKPIHLKQIDITSEKADVTVQLSEAPTYADGTGVTPIGTNRMYGGVKKFKQTILPADLTVDVPVLLSPQPADGVAPVVSYVRNGNVIIHPDVAVAIATDPINDSEGEDYLGYGIEVKDVAQVDRSKGLNATYKAKKIFARQYTESKSTWAVDTAYKFTNQGSDIADDAGEPTIVTVYNGTRELASDEYVVEQITDVGVDQYKWTIKIPTSEDVDTDLLLFFTYIVNKSEVTDFTQVFESGAWDWQYQRIEIGQITGTFEVGEEVTGGTSEATGVIEAVIDGDTDYLIVSGVVGAFQDEETLTGGTSEATVTSGSVGVNFNWYAFETQSHDESAITVASVFNDTEELSKTADYSIADSTGFKITLLDTAKTDDTKPLIVVFSVQTMMTCSSDMVVVTAPTVTAQGSVIDTYRIYGEVDTPSKTSGDGRGSEWEIILRPNTKYLVKVISPNAGKVLLKYRWYIEEC